MEDPEIVRQSGRYGVKLQAAAPSIHMMRANINTEISPIVGSERQSEELVNYLMEEFKEDPISIWQSNIFGTSLHELVNEGLHNKLYRMPTEARMKLQETIEKQGRLIADLITTLESWEQTAGYDGAELKERALEMQIRERQVL